MNAPIIRAVDEPTELHCQRKIGEMCAWIADEQGRIFQGSVEAILRGEAWPANPKAQERFVRRWCEAFKWSLLATELCPAKRGRSWEFSYYFWRVATPRYEKPWLECVHTRLRFERVGRRAAVEHRRMFSISNHALVRLAMRCGARSPEDISLSVKGLWEAFSANEGGDFIAPVAGGWAPFVQSAEDGTLIVKTVLASEMRPVALTKGETLDAQ
jgi:hypothetical protein